MLAQYAANSWIGVAPAPPLMTPASGAVSGTQPLDVSLTNTPNSGAGEIYYRVDGDPRAPGGGVAPGAVSVGDNGALQVPYTATVYARVLNAGVWSPLTLARYDRPDTAPPALPRPIWLPLAWRRAGI